MTPEFINNEIYHSGNSESKGRQESLKEGQVHWSRSRFIPGETCGKNAPRKDQGKVQEMKGCCCKPDSRDDFIKSDDNKYEDVNLDPCFNHCKFKEGYLCFNSDDPYPEERDFDFKIFQMH